MHCDRCGKDCEPVELKPLANQIVCGTCIAEAMPPGDLYDRARALAYSKWLPTDDDSPVFRDAFSALDALVAAQMISAMAVAALDALTAGEIDGFADLTRGALCFGTETSLFWLHILHTTFVMPEQDRELAAAGLSVHAVESSGHNEREALLRLLAAADVLGRDVNPSADEIEELGREAKIIGLGINGPNEINPNEEPDPIPNAPGGDA